MTSHVTTKSPRSQPRARARARDRSGGAAGRAAGRHGRQGGRRPGRGGRHARCAAHDPHGRRRGDRRGGEGRGADARQRRAASATGRRRTWTSRSIRSRARAWPRQGRPNALAVIALSERGTMFDPGPVFYMEKMAARDELVDLLDLDRPLGKTVELIAERRGVEVRDVMVVVLDRPRHEAGIKAIRDAGARVRLITDGDVAGALLAAAPGPPRRPAVGDRRHARGRDLRRGAEVLRRRADRPPVAARRRRAQRATMPGTTSPRCSPTTTSSRARTASSAPPA